MRLKRIRKKFAYSFKLQPKTFVFAFLSLISTFPFCTEGLYNIGSESRSREGLG